MSKGDLSLYTDAVIMETLIGDPSFVKTADISSILSGASSVIQDYVSSHIDQNDKVGSVINMLAPTAITMLFRAFGFGKLGFLLGLGASALHVNIAGIVESIWNKVKEVLSSGQKVTPAHVDSAVAEAIQQNSPTDEEISLADDAPLGSSLAQDLREARLLRLALEQQEHQMLRLTKEAAPNFLVSYGIGRRGRTTNLAARVIGWIFKTALMSAGLLVAGDVAAKMLGMPSAIDHTWHAGRPDAPSGGPSTVPAPVTTQTKFKANPMGATPPQPWIESTPNNRGAIENMLLNFTKEVYAGLDGKESFIRSSPTFQAVADQISWYNHMSPGDNFIYIPPNYSNKKSIVDHYIDEVAKNSP